MTRLRAPIHALCGLQLLLATLPALAQSPAAKPGLAVALTGTDTSTSATLALAAKLDSTVRSRLNCLAVQPLLLDSLGRRAGTGLAAARGAKFVAARWLLMSAIARISTDSVYFHLGIASIESSQIVASYRRRIRTLDLDTAVRLALISVVDEARLPKEPCW